MANLTKTFKAFTREKAVVLCPTTMSTAYRQDDNWFARCPYQDLETEAREIMIWVLEQSPRKSAIRIASRLKTLTRWAASDGVEILSRDPLASFPVPKPPQNDREICVIPDREVPLLCAGMEVRDKRLPRWDLWVQFQLQIGARTGEVPALTVDDIQNDKIKIHRNWTLTHGLKQSTKTNKPRWVPLNPVAQGIIHQLKPVNGFLFPWNRYSFQSFFKARVLKMYNAGVLSHNYRIYDLRHTAISRWIQAGIPVTTCAVWAGNSTKVIFEHYAAPTKEYTMPIL